MISRNTKYIFFIFTISLFGSCTRGNETANKISINFYAAFNQEEVFGKLWECDSVTNLYIKKLPVDTTSISYHYYPILRSVYFDPKVNPILSKLFFYFKDSARVPYVTREIYIGNCLSSDTHKIRSYLTDNICRELYSENLNIKWYNIDKDSTVCDLILLKKSEHFFDISESDVQEIRVLKSPSILRDLDILLGREDVENDRTEYNISFVLKNDIIKKINSLYNEKAPFLIEVYMLNKLYIGESSIRDLNENKTIKITKSNLNKDQVEELKKVFSDKIKLVE